MEVACALETEGPTPRTWRRSRTATFTVEAVQEREKITDHDVAAFVDVLSASAGEAGRWIHYGLTSSDVLDTALGVQLRKAGDILLAGAREYRDALIEQARAQVDTRLRRAHPRRARRADDLRHQARGLRLRGRPQSASGWSARSTRSRVGAVSGAVGTYSATSPDFERRVLARLGLEAEPVSTQVVAARPPRRAAAGDRAGRRRPGALRHRVPPPAAHRGPRGRGAVPRRRAEGLERDAAQAQPDRRRSASPAWRASCAATPKLVRKTWRSGTSATSRTPAPSGSCCPTRRSRWTTCRRSPRALARGMVVHADRMRENIDLTYGALFSQRVLLGARRRRPAARRRLPHRPAHARSRRGTRARRCARCWRPSRLGSIWTHLRLGALHQARRRDRRRSTLRRRAPWHDSRAIVREAPQWRERHSSRAAPFDTFRA